MSQVGKLTWSRPHSYLPACPATNGLSNIGIDTNRYRIRMEARQLHAPGVSVRGGGRRRRTNGITETLAAPYTQRGPGYRCWAGPTVGDELTQVRLRRERFRVDPSSRHRPWHRRPQYRYRAISEQFAGGGLSSPPMGSVGRMFGAFTSRRTDSGDYPMRQRSPLHGRAFGGPGTARFDDVIDNSSISFPASERVLVATEAAEVASVLALVDEATQAGWWAFGFVGYEAAAGLNPALPVTDSAHRSAKAQTPLVWFGLSRDPVSATAADPPQSRGTPIVDGVDVGWSPASYQHAFDEVKAAIADGETYQCNLTTTVSGSIVSRSRAPCR